MTKQPVTSSVDIEHKWREHGWPEPLLARARELHISNGQIENWFAWNASLQRVEEELTWAERLLRGDMRFRQLTIADNDAFCELWANSPEDLGEWEVTVERGPNGFAQFQLQERPILNGLFERGVMVACVSFSLRQTLVAGQPVSIRYGQAMRVHGEHRGKALAHWVRSLPWAIGVERPTRVQYDYIRGHNMTMERWNRRFMPSVESVPKREGDVPGMPVTVHLFPAQAVEDGAPGVRVAGRDDLGACVALINRTHHGRDLFRPYTREFLADRLAMDWTGNPAAPPGRPPYGIGDLYVLERGGEIVACGGLWDRGRDLRERWHQLGTDEERVTSGAAALDLGFAEGHAGALAVLIEHLVGVAHTLGRDYLVVPLETMPDVAELLAHRAPLPDTRYLQWRTDAPSLAAPPHVDLVYW